MNPQILMYAMQVLQALPLIIQTAQGIGTAISFVKQTNANLAKMQEENRAPTPEEWALLNATIADLRMQLHAPK